MKTKTILLSLLVAFATTASIKAQEVGDMAPDFTLTGLSGEAFKLSDHKEKVVFIFFFGNDCAHCKANGPNTQTDIYAIYKDNPDFVAIGIDTWDGNSSAVESYQATTEIEYDLLLAGSGVQSDYSTTYDRIIVIDQEGKIQYKATSNADKGVTAEASGVIEGLLNTTGIFNKSKALSFNANFNHHSGELSFSNPFDQENLATVHVFDITGRVINTATIELQDQNTLTIDRVPKGLYIVRISNGQQSYAAKFRTL